MPKSQGKSGKRLFTVEETAYYLGLSPRTIYNAVAPKSKTPFPVKPKRMGKAVRFDIRDLDLYVDSLNSVDTGFAGYFLHVNLSKHTELSKSAAYTISLKMLNTLNQSETGGYFRGVVDQVLTNHNQKAH